MKKLLINHSTDPAFNLALEELIASKYPFEAIMLWRNAPSIIVGRNQNTEAEINAEAVRARGIQVVRRITGGGAVYHDLGNINYTIAVNERLLDNDAFAHNAQMIIDVLKRFDIPAEFKGRNDILADGRKISGSAKSVFVSRTLFHGTLLFDTDLTVLSQVLTPDEEKIRAKGIKSVRSRVANLREYLPHWDVDIFLENLQKELLSIMELPEITPIPENLIQEAQELAESKYRTWEWNFGSITEYNYTRKSRFDCGTVGVSFDVRKNCIENLVFFGDFFGNRPAAELAEKLNGSVPSYEMIAAKLAAVNVSEYINGLSAGELLTLFRIS